MEMSSSPRKSARSTTFNTAVRGKERIWTICGASISDTKLAQSVVSYATVILVVAFGSAYAALALSRPLQPIHEIPAQADPDVEATRQFDQNVNLVRLNFTSTQIDARQGNRGWMLNPIHTAATAGLQGATSYPPDRNSRPYCRPSVQIGKSDNNVSNTKKVNVEVQSATD